MKLLMSAYACRPGLGSEPGAGWAWAEAATRDHDVWLLTHTANAPVLEFLRASDPRLFRRLHPNYLHLGGRAERLRRGGPLRFLYYAIWQITVCRRTALQLHAEVGFDICHHVTYASDWLPAGVAAVTDVPFVWGPVGGSSTMVGPRLGLLLGFRALCSELIRRVTLTAMRATVGHALARRAAIVLGQNNDVAAAFAPVPVTVEPHIALEQEAASVRQAAKSGAAPCAVYAGRLLGWKGLRLALAALARPEASSWRLDVFGDGPERIHLERLAARLAIADRVRFLGARPRGEVRTALSQADVLLFPSTHDAAGWVVAEAMAAGCPVLALDRGGPATLVQPGDGVLVPPVGDVVGALAQGLASARGLRPRRDRWRAERLPSVISGVYQRALATRDAREGAAV